MTLKNYLETNNIKATPDQRSQLGRIISTKGDSTRYVTENHRNVKDYKESFLNKPKTQLAIINHLTK
ncbi:hypothetical protein [Polaribacter sp. IC073]|uniref:hypothetical protein n=1 Tax=Polaribacter sp. IC073 TaxID=2508540 RepID=UPI0011BE354E|nr:hypothetical protein [Polaribacter sp. IC073]TXD45887.1 hypothetical protein ES045_15800 [Polaribacter sp. IC073]